MKKSKATPKKSKPALRGNKNALKHGGYAKKDKSAKDEKQKLRALENTIVRLEEVQDRIFDMIHSSNDVDQSVKLINAFSNNAIAIFSGHRTIQFVSGTATPIDEAFEELKTLDFDED